MKKIQKLKVILLTLVVLFCAIPSINVDASSTKIFFHVRSTVNISSYDLNGNVIGTIYPSDECWTTNDDIVRKVDGSYWVKVRYPTSNGEKTAYISYDKIWASGGGRSGETYTSTYNRTTYWRSDMSTSFGSIYAGDRVYIEGVYGNVAQVLYPVSKGVKLAWVYTSQLN